MVKLTGYTRDIVLNEQTAEKLLRMRDPTLNHCNDVWRSYRVADKITIGTNDNISQVKSKNKKTNSDTEGRTDLAGRKNDFLQILWL